MKKYMGEHEPMFGEDEEKNQKLQELKEEFDFLLVSLQTDIFDPSNISKLIDKFNRVYCLLQRGFPKVEKTWNTIVASIELLIPTELGTKHMPAEDKKDRLNELDNYLSLIMEDLHKEYGSEIFDA